MKISLNIEIAIAQFGNPDDIELKTIAQKVSKKGIHWYYFDETADEKFELEQLCEHYNIVYKCYESKYMERVK